MLRATRRPQIEEAIIDPDFIYGYLHKNRQYFDLLLTAGEIDVNVTKDRGKNISPNGSYAETLTVVSALPGCV